MSLQKHPACTLLCVLVVFSCNVQLHVSHHHPLLHPWISFMLCECACASSMLVHLGVVDLMYVHIVFQQ